MPNEQLTPSLEVGEKFLQILEKLEPVFVQAGDLALKMQKEAKHHNKYSTGNPLVDIVTNADLAVQEFLLQEISKTNLVKCHLFAEENTALTEKFDEQGQYYLGIDPIDGTAVYSEGGNQFCVIITLHDGKDLLYTFVYFPALKLTHKIIRNYYTITGQIPEISLPANVGKMILYWSGEPEKNVPKKLQDELKKKGLIFVKATDFAKDIALINLFSAGKVAGVYYGKLNAYDSLVELHAAIAKGKKHYIGEGFDLTKPQKRIAGYYYPGSYLVLNESL